MTRILFSLLMTAFVVVIIAASVEIFTRTAIDDGYQFDLEMWKYAKQVKRKSDDPLIGHEHQPNSAGHLMGVDVEINSKGLRDYEYAYERTPGVERILMLGDSLTFGWGVPFEETWSKRLERAFEASGENVEVINTGVGNYNTVMEAQYFFTEGYKYDADIIVLNFFINDAENLPVYSEPDVFEDNLESYIFVKGRVDTLARQLGSREDWRDYYSNLYREDADGWIALKESMRRLADYARENDKQLVVVHHPELREFDPYPFGAVEEKLRAFVESLDGVEYLDLLPVMRRAEPEELWVTAPDPHPNGYANALAAEGMMPLLKELLARE